MSTKIQLNDVNTTDIRDAISLACKTMSRCFDADDNDFPFFKVDVRPVAKMEFSGAHSEAHTPGRHLNALLNAENALGIVIDEEAVDNNTRATFFSYDGAVPLPLNRQEVGGPLVNFLPHNIREGFHALYALAKYRNSDDARQIAEASIDAILKLWNSEREWDDETLQRRHGLTVFSNAPFISGIARTIGPLVKYYRATGYGPALELAILLKEKCIGEVFHEDGSFDAARFGTHNHSTTCVMSSLAQLADLTHDSALLHLVKQFYDNGLRELRDEIGWSPESADDARRTGQGEMNNTGDILETALILGRWGYTDYYGDAERMIRCHILPSQLRDVSFVEEPLNPNAVDGLRNVANRLRGAWGFPAPYGHEPIGLVGHERYRVAFNLDIVGGTVGSLCEAYRETTQFDNVVHRVNLLFDHETEHIHVRSPYTHPSLEVTVKQPGPLFVRIPPWADDDQLRISGYEGVTRRSNGYLLMQGPPVNRPISIEFPLTERETVLDSVTGPIRAQLRGDSVVAMDNLGADLTFFDPH